MKKITPENAHEVIDRVTHIEEAILQQRRLLWELLEQAEVVLGCGVALDDIEGLATDADDMGRFALAGVRLRREFGDLAPWWAGVVGSIVCPAVWTRVKLKDGRIVVLTEPVRRADRRTR